MTITIKKSIKTPTTRKARAKGKVKTKVDPKTEFKENFIKSEFSVIERFDFTKSNMELLDYMRSEEVNDPASNRSKDKDNIYRLLRTLKAGHWHRQAAVFQINKNGKLMNGQHTLDAISLYLLDVETDNDAVVEVIFFLGCNEDSMPYIDTQKKRSPHQNLRIRNGKSNIKLNRMQENIVLIEAKREVHNKPFGACGQVQFFEYDAVVKKNQGILSRVFRDRVLSTDFPKSISYALFCLAKEDEELANDILDEICNFRNQDNRPLSRWYPARKKVLQEHELVERFREEKHLKISGMTSSTGRDCYRAEEFYPIAIEWLTENYDIDSKIFPR